MTNTINEEFFFAHVRVTLFAGRLKQKQVDGLKGLLDYWNDNLAASDDRWLAYVLATAFHETAHSMQSIKEIGTVAYLNARYDINGGNPRLARSLGNLDPGDGAKYAGRGFVQLTGKNNYRDWTRRLNLPGIDLVQAPDLALRPDIATMILFKGMIEGTFTSKKLSNYFTTNRTDWIGARRIVNGQDRSQMIADYALKFYAAISPTA